MVLRPSRPRPSRRSSTHNAFKELSRKRPFAFDIGRKRGAGCRGRSTPCRGSDRITGPPDQEFPIPPASLPRPTLHDPEPGPVAVSLHDDVLARLRECIVEGRVAEGDRVPERQLCELFGVSRTPLREALKVLAAEGLVELLPNRGARVPRLSSADVRALFDLMGGLESLAGRLACANATDAFVAEVETLQHDMYGFYLRRDLHGYFAINQRIHAAILDAAANPPLSAAYKTCADRVRRFRYVANQGQRRDRWGEAVREHEAILDALRRRAAGETADLLFAHLRNKAEAALEARSARDG